MLSSTKFHFFALIFSYLQYGANSRNAEKPGATSTLNNDCPCGFYDATNDNLFTESLIVYFNETTTFPTNQFTIQDYKHKWEKGFNTIYREGASTDNVMLSNASDSANSTVFPYPSLRMYIDTAEKNHLVVGSQINSVRQDIQYGSFSALVRGPSPYSGGSVMSMIFHHNDSQTFEMDLQNTNSPQTAWLATLMAGEFPDRSLGINYTTLNDTSLSNYTSSPYDYVNLQVDWDYKSINFSYNDVVTRSITRKEDSSVPSVPGPLIFQHWSDGDKYSSQGPPHERNAVNIVWIRTFFNSSTMTKINREDFNDRCSISLACSTADLSLRGSSSYAPNATVPWKQHKSGYGLKYWAIAMVSSGCAAGALVLLNMVTRRLIEGRASSKKEVAPSTDSHEIGARVGVNGTHIHESAASSTTAVSSPNTTTFSSPIHTVVNSRAASISGPSATQLASNYFLPLERVEHQNVGAGPLLEADIPKEEDDIASAPTSTKVVRTSKDGRAAETVTSELRRNQNVAAPAPMPTAPTPIQPVKPLRIDYMAGMTAICSLLVTFAHFALTFVPSLDSGNDSLAHYHSEIVARRIFTPFVTNAIWVDLFFTVSTRFLSMNYFRNGNLKNVAEKTVARPFRLLIPVAGVVILEYFLIDCGATMWLEYLPSITWSQWPYVVDFKNFGEFLNEVLELAYLIPLAAPQITFNYCTGVLWTIPVSLQGSWVCLLGVVFIREVKNPWKRFGFYSYALIVNWYARSWGAYFWAGLLMTDLDVTYKYRKWLYARPWAHWSLSISCLLAAIGALSFDLIQADTGISILIVERGIHPDQITGRPLAQTVSAGYPTYYEPRLNGLIFSIAVSTGVEVTPFVQKILSTKVFMWLFPHMFTIYLIHGLIFWTLGSVVCVHLSAAGVPYWANILIVAVLCYGVLFASLDIVTPAIEMLGKHVTAFIWRYAIESPANKEGTLFPFNKELLLEREGADPHVGAVDEGDEKSMNEDGKGEKELEKGL